VKHILQYRRRGPTLIRLARLLALPVLALSGVAIGVGVAGATSTVVFTGAPGTGAPPATLGGYHMTAFPTDARPVFTSVSTAPGPFGQNVAFSRALTHRRVGSYTTGWLNWSNGYSRDVYFSFTTSSVTLNLPPGTKAFYLYAQSDEFGTYQFTAHSQNGSASSGAVSIDNTPSGTSAKYFGFYATGTTNVISVTVSRVGAGSFGYAIGEFGISDNQPSNVKATAGDAQATVSWTAVPGGRVYKVYDSTTPGAENYSNPPACRTTGKTSCTVTGLTNGQPYYFTVVASFANGNSAPSSEVTATPELPAPTGVTAAAGNGKVTISWNGVLYATSYRVYKGTTPLTVSTLACTTATHKCTVTGLTNTTTYYFDVVALSPASAPSAVVTATPSPVPGFALFAQYGGVATWTSSNTVATLSLPTGTTPANGAAGIQVLHPPSTLPATAPTFTTNAAHSGSPRWVIFFTTGRHVFGYASQTVSPPGNWTGNTVPYGSTWTTVKTTYAGQHVTTVFIVMDTDQAPPSQSTITTVTYGTAHFA
jgi:hypothetical protein